MFKNNLSSEGLIVFPSTIDTKSKIAVINPSDNTRYYRSGEQIAHASFRQQVNMMSQESVNLCSAVFDLVSIVDGKTIKPSEDKLFLNTEEFIFDVTEINCHSSLSENKDWLNQLHIKYKKTSSQILNLIRELQ